MHYPIVTMADTNEKLHSEAIWRRRNSPPTMRSKSSGRLKDEWDFILATVVKGFGGLSKQVNTPFSRYTAIMMCRVTIQLVAKNHACRSRLHHVGWWVKYAATVPPIHNDQKELQSQKFLYTEWTSDNTCRPPPPKNCLQRSSPIMCLLRSCFIIRSWPNHDACVFFPMMPIDVPHALKHTWRCSRHQNLVLTGTEGSTGAQPPCSS